MFCDLFLEKKIKLNNQDCKRDSIIKNGDVISITEDEEIDFVPENKKLDIIEQKKGENDLCGQ